MNTEKLKDMMFGKNINARDLAQKINMSEGGLSLILNGKRKCSLVTAQKLAIALRMTSKDIRSIFFGDTL